MTFLGFERPDGQAGTRNLIGILSVMDNVNTIARRVARDVNGTVPITTLFVRGQYGWELELAYNTLAGLGRNANLAGVVVVGLERTSTDTVAERISNSGKPVESVIVQEVGGSVAATAEATRKASRMVIEASRQVRREMPESMLTVGVECGGSDTSSGLVSNPLIGRISDRIVDAGGRVVISETSEFLGAEEMFAERAVNDEVRKIFVDKIIAFEGEATGRGVDIRGNNPSPDNIRGGLTTIEEKAIGAMAKAGSRPLVDVLDYGEVPTRLGMHFMATPAPAVESMTGLAAGGCQMVLFSTGVGNTVGNMVATTVKVTSNIKTATALADNIDFDCSDVLEQSTPMDHMADSFHEYVLEVASGRMTTSEVLDERETAISRFERSF